MSHFLTPSIRICARGIHLLRGRFDLGKTRLMNIHERASTSTMRCFSVPFRKRGIASSIAEERRLRKNRPQVESEGHHLSLPVMQSLFTAPVTTGLDQILSPRWMDPSNKSTAPTTSSPTTSSHTTVFQEVQYLPNEGEHLPTPGCSMLETVAHALLDLQEHTPPGSLEYDALMDLRRVISSAHCGLREFFQRADGDQLELVRHALSSMKPVACLDAMEEREFVVQQLEQVTGKVVYLAYPDGDFWNE